MSLTSLPTKFKGCLWDDNWEFDAPCVIYFPRRYRRYAYGGNSGKLIEIVEDICERLRNGTEPNDGGIKHECEWRGWGQRFDRRKNAEHITFHVRWFDGDDGKPDYEITEDAAQERKEGVRG
jgi:hypothetical protein